MKTFPLSLSGDTRKWKFYPISCARNYDKMCDNEDEGRDPLEFIPWMNSKFKDHKKVDETTKCAILYTWIEVGNEEGLMDEVSSDEEWGEHEYGTLPNPAAKPNLDTHYQGDGSNHEKQNKNGNELENFPTQTMQVIKEGCAKLKCLKL
ncbi:hypothetical protein Tco_0467511 [Tanacetum coccineum]